MKRVLSLIVCVVLVCCCAVSAWADEATAPIDATEGNTGPGAGNAFFIFALVVAIGGSIYLAIKFRKRD